MGKKSKEEGGGWPTTPTAPSGDGGTPVNTGLPSGMPAWWKNTKATGITDADLAANALLPFMDNSGQRATASRLGGQYSDYSNYLNIPTGPPSIQTNPYMLSSKRAMGALQNLSAMGVDKNTAGYKYISSVLNALASLGSSGGSAMSRAAYNEFSRTISGLSSAFEASIPQADQAKFAPYADLVNLLTKPVNDMMAQTKTQTGRTIYGQANTQLFG